MAQGSWSQPPLSSYVKNSGILENKSCLTEYLGDTENKEYKYYTVRKSETGETTEYTQLDSSHQDSVSSSLRRKCLREQLPLHISLLCQN
jgi:hypothetical protein